MALVKTEHRKGEPSKTTCREICRYYINGKGQCEVIGLKRTMGPYLDCFSYYEGMALRYDNDTYSHLATFPLYPKMDVIPELERNGFTGDLYGLAPVSRIWMRIPCVTICSTDFVVILSGSSCQ